MILNENNGIKYFTFEKMNNIKHCFSTRVGGVSEGCYKSLNLAFRQDSRENVLENYRRICSVIGVDYKNTFWTKQVHTDRIVRACESDRGKGLFYDRQEEGYDALITNVKDVVLTGFSADCVLIFFYDPVNEAVDVYKRQVMSYAKDDAVIMHPGSPDTRVEISADLVESKRCILDDQITNGVAIRMALLYLLSMGRGI